MNFGQMGVRVRMSARPGTLICCGEVPSRFLDTSDRMFGADSPTFRGGRVATLWARVVPWQATGPCSRLGEVSMDLTALQPRSMALGVSMGVQVADDRTGLTRGASARRSQRVHDGR